MTVRTRPGIAGFFGSSSTSAASTAADVRAELDMYAHRFRSCGSAISDSEVPAVVASTASSVTSRATAGSLGPIVAPIARASHALP